MPLRFINNQVQWQGERINGILHPFHIEEHWTEQELQAIGLEVFTIDPPEIPDVSNRTLGSFTEFMDLLTAQEQLDIVTETQTDASIKLWWDLLLGSHVVELTDPSMDAAFDDLVLAGVFTQPRADAILGSTFP